MLLLIFHVNTRDMVDPKKTNNCSAAYFFSKLLIIQFNIHFWRITLTAKFHIIRVH